MGYPAQRMLERRNPVDSRVVWMNEIYAYATGCTSTLLSNRQNSHPQQLLESSASKFKLSMSVLLFTVDVYHTIVAPPLCN